MDDLYQLIQQRNRHETDPFTEIHQANATLVQQIDALKTKCNDLERELVIEKEHHPADSASNGGRGVVPQSLSLKQETKLREKLEKLQEELNEKLKQSAAEQSNILALTKEISSLKDLNVAQASTIANLKAENERKEKAIDHMTIELVDAKSRTKLAEQQYTGLKDMIRVLQEDNDALKKENDQFSTRLVSEKGNMIDEMNKLTEMVDKYKREVDILHSLKEQDEKRKSWFTLGSKSSQKQETNDKGDSETRKFGSMAVVVPSAPMHTIQAHQGEASCVQYDASGMDLVATGGADSIIQVWDTANGQLRQTLRGGSSNPILSCDISNGVVIAGGSDKTCRVWNMRTGRMIHHLVGHAHKITCVKLFGSEKGVVTGSADRSIKVWDISRQTYKQTTTFRHSSTANCVDVSSDLFTVVTAHLDGGVRLFHLQTGERLADISGIHQGAVTSVQFHPKDASKILTNGMDSTLKIVDIRTCTAIHTFSDAQLQTSYGWASASFSPDGMYVGAGSATGMVLVWEVDTGKLPRKLSNHQSCVCGFAWSRGGFSGQQVASVDKKGVLTLWS
ncbi:MAG: hypothetical protein SGBAC_000764 [Bacillariaceae sp.]